jgi:hypothetical protein
MRLLNVLSSNQNSKLEHVMIQFKIHNIHISDQAQFSMINMSLKWHKIKCKKKLQKMNF